MITIKKNDEENEFLLNDGENLLGKCCFDKEKGEILSYEINYSDIKFVFLNLTLAVLNYFDLNGVKTVGYNKEKNTDFLIELGFIKTDNGLILNLEGYFDKKHC